MFIVTYLQRCGPVLFLAGVLAVGCNRDDSAIRTYSAPKDEASHSPAMAMDSSQQPAPSDAQADATAPIQWTLPSGWQQTGGSGEMRYATLEVSHAPKAEVTVVPLGAEAGAILPNVSRWAGQLKLPAPTDADLAKFVSQTQVSGEQAQFIEMTGSEQTGTPPTALLAAIIPHAGRVWFFTLKAPQLIVAAQKASFETFIHSIQFPTEPAASAAPSADSPHGQMANPPDAGSYRLASWKTPAGWQGDRSVSMRMTSFRVTDGGAAGGGHRLPHPAGSFRVAGR